MMVRYKGNIKFASANILYGFRSANFDLSWFKGYSQSYHDFSNSLGLMYYQVRPKIAPKTATK